MVERGVGGGGGPALAGPLSSTARKVIGLEELATLPVDGGDRGGRTEDPAVRRLPAQVASPDPGRC